MIRLVISIRMKIGIRKLGVWEGRGFIRNETNHMYVHIIIPQNDCKLHVPQIRTNKILKVRKINIKKFNHHLQAFNIM